MRLTFLLLLLFLMLSPLSANRALNIKKYGNETKTALVIGNSNYRGKLSKLKNPKNDARDVKNALQKLGFKVLYLQNANQADFDDKLREFTHRLKSSGVGLFYFAGHGLEVDKQNYLVPIGADVSDKYKVKYKTIAVNEIVDRMKSSGTRLNMVILDACRNDPFSRGGGGLATMPNAKGTLVAYATEAGAVASDNAKDRNGLYTKHLLKALKRGGVHQRDLFHQVRQGVYDESKGRQLPYLNDGTMGDFYFSSAPKRSKKEQQGKKQKAKKSSSFSFSDDAPSTFALTVNTKPSNAHVNITNISSRYYDGIELKSGEYTIKVSKKGYYAKTGSVNLEGDLNIDIVLNKKRKKVLKKPVESLNDKRSSLAWTKESSRNTKPPSYKTCIGCHGFNGEKNIMAPGSRPNTMSKEEIVKALKGYKAGTINKYGKGAIMRGFSSRLSEKQMRDIANYIGK